MNGKQDIGGEAIQRLEAIAFQIENAIQALVQAVEVMGYHAQAMDSAAHTMSSAANRQESAAATMHMANRY